MKKPTPPLFFRHLERHKERLNGATMKLTPRNKRQTHSPGPRIAIGMDEITADLNYRGGEPRRAGAPAPAPSGRR